MKQIIDTVLSFPGIVLNIVLIVFFLFLIIDVYSQNAFTLSSTIINETEKANITTITTDNRSLALNENESQTKLDIENIAGNDTGIAVMVAKELSEKTPEEIAIYPLNDLSPEDIEKALKIMSTADLEKTLFYTSPYTLGELLNNKLTQDKVREILDRLPPDKSQEILDRMP